MAEITGLFLHVSIRTGTSPDSQEVACGFSEIYKGVGRLDVAAESALERLKDALADVAVILWQEHRIDSKVASATTKGTNA